MKLIVIVLLSLIATTFCAVPTCDNYCTIAMQACSGSLQIYTSMADCLRVCPGLPLGTDDTATSGNTIGCRIYHAGVANGSAAAAITHCPHVSPSGGTACGDLCEAYCSIMGNACNATANNPFTATSNCTHACSYYDTTGNFTTQGGANIYCKIYHATAALGSTGAATTHCPHASPSGNGACGTKCENFCSESAKTCTGNLTLYANNADCMQFCNSLPDGAITDVSGNTKDCRIYHSLVAGTSAANAMTHCPHATHSGGNVCGSWCDVYCQMAIQHCTGNLTLFASTSACMTACSPIANTGKPNDASGNSIQCRIYHLGVASAGGATAVTHCPHAAVASKDNVCGTIAPSTSTPSPSSTTGNAYAIIVSSLMLVAVLLF